jgi:hypothetical protein
VDALRKAIIRELGYRFYLRHSGRARPQKNKSSSEDNKSRSGAEPHGLAASSSAHSCGWTRCVAGIAEGFQGQTPDRMLSSTAIIWTPEPRDEQLAATVYFSDI